jgi:hypothetical protein
MKRLLFFIFTLLFNLTSYAYIPRTLMVLQKTVENNGSGSYQIEQEVQFQTLQEPLILKETWIIENESQMRLVVTGTKEFKDSIKMTFIYNGNNKSFMQNGTRYNQKVSDDFFERYFHFRRTESFANQLISLKMINSSVFNKKTQKPTEYQAEPFIRLSRTGGVVNYALGQPTPAEAASLNPGVWIEQDQFIIRKLRLPSEAEISAERHSSFARGLTFPRKRTLRWGGNLVTLQTLNVLGKPTLTNFNLENNRLDPLETSPVKQTVEEFYKRFR